MTRAAAGGLFLLLATLGTACSSESSEERGADTADTGADRAASGAADGAAVYESSCAECHGADLRGTDRGPSHLSQVYEPGHHPDASFRSAIENGSPAHHWEFGDMPPVEGLDDDEVDAVIAFIREQQEAQGFEPYPPE